MSEPELITDSQIIRFFGESSAAVMAEEEEGRKIDGRDLHQVKIAGCPKRFQMGV